MPASPILAAKQRRQLHPFLFSMGPVTLSIISVLLIGLMAILYLTQVGQAVAANQQLQNLQAQQATLQRQNQDLVNTIAQEQSPAYIAQKAREQGLIPSAAKDVQHLLLKNLKPFGNNQNSQP